MNTISSIAIGECNDNQLQYSCLENSIDSRTWQATVHGVIRGEHDLVTKPPSVANLGATGRAVYK